MGNNDTVFLIAAACIYLLLLVFTWLFLTPKPKKRFRIDLMNNGNVVSNYLISIAPFDQTIKYQVSRDGVRLPQHLDDEAEEASKQGAVLIEEEPPQKVAALQKRDTTKLTDKVSDAAQTGRKAVGMAGALASILGIVGTLLPGKAGRSFKSRATQIRSKQASASRKMQAPRQAQSRAKALQSSANQLGGGRASPSESPSRELVEESPAELPTQKKEKKVRKKQPTVFRTVVEDLIPGDSVVLDLLVVQRKRNQFEPGFLFTFESQQQPLEDTETALAPVRRQAAVNFDPITFWRWLIPVVSSIALTAALVWILLPI